jgi:hypothetical protein
MLDLNWLKIRLGLQLFLCFLRIFCPSTSSTSVDTLGFFPNEVSAWLLKWSHASTLGVLISGHVRREDGFEDHWAEACLHMLSDPVPFDFEMLAACCLLCLWWAGFRASGLALSLSTKSGVDSQTRALSFNFLYPPPNPYQLLLGTDIQCIAMYSNSMLEGATAHWSFDI